MKDRFLSQTGYLGQGKVADDGGIGMDTGTDIGRCIDDMELSDHIGEDVVSRQNLGAKIHRRWI